MYYHNPRIDDGKFGPLVFVEGVNQLTRQWQDKEMTPGKWAENVIQAIGRDLLYYGKFKLREAGYKIIGSIYDEVIAEVAAARQTERGTRADDKRSETAMEDRKKEGYF